MATKVNVHSIQDLPPAGGFPSVPTTRNLRPRGPSGLAIWTAVLGCSAFGFYMIGKTNEHRRLVRKEKRELRMALFPYLQSERDRELQEKITKHLAHEAEVMKDVSDWVVGENVYSKRWHNPTTFR